MKYLALSLLLAFVLPACNEDKAILITGESLIGAGDTFVATAAGMDAALDAKKITPADYKKWAAFGRKFQASYFLARNLWQVAADNHDEKIQAQAGAVLTQLVGDLGTYAALAGVKP